MIELIRNLNYTHLIAAKKPEYVWLSFRRAVYLWAFVQYSAPLSFSFCPSCLLLCLFMQMAHTQRFDNSILHLLSASCQRFAFELHAEFISIIVAAGCTVVRPFSPSPSSTSGTPPSVQRCVRVPAEVDLAISICIKRLDDAQVAVPCQLLNQLFPPLSFFFFFCQVLHLVKLKSEYWSAALADQRDFSHTYFANWFSL